MLLQYGFHTNTIIVGLKCHLDLFIQGYKKIRLGTIK